MRRGSSLIALRDRLIGWQDASAGIRSRLLRAISAGVRPRSLISNSITLTIVIGIVIADTPDPRLPLAWLVLVILGGLLPRAYAATLRRRGGFEQATERKALGFILISALYGLLWGAGPFLLLPRIDGAATGILLFVMVFGTIMGPYATMPGILYARMAATGIPTLIAVGLYMPPQVLLACLVVSAWLVLRTDVWRGYHRTLRQQFELQEALEARQAELEAANLSKEEANRKLEKMAQTDPLTGAFNRRQLVQRLRVLHGPAALLLFDVDHFKRINDEFGHVAGDAVLVELVRLVRGIMRKHDLLARIGGEEFAVVLHRADPDSAWAFAERLRQRVEQHAVTVGEREVRITVSVGITMLGAGEPAAEAVALLSEADGALYEAKHRGRNIIRLAPGRSPV